MKRVRFRILVIAVITVLLCGCWFFVSCLSNFNIVRLNGISSGANYSHHPGTTKFIESDGRNPVMLLWDGDLFGVNFGEKDLPPEDIFGKEDFFTMYRLTDGFRPSFINKENFLLLQSGRPISLNIDEVSEKSAWDWLKKAKAKEIQSLRFFSVNMGAGGIDNSHVLLLKKIARINPHIGLGLNTAAIEYILPFFRPYTLLISADVPLAEKEIRLLQQQRGLRTLVVVFKGDLETDYSALSFVSGLTRLKRLAIYGNKNASLSTPRQFFTLPHSIQSLQLIGCPTDTLSFLARLSRLRELGLQYCEIKDTASLAKLKRLTAIDLSNMEDTSGISELKEMPRLKYLAVPSTVKLNVLVSSLRRCRHLEILCFQGTQIDNFGFLKELSSLRALIIIQPSSGEQIPFNYSSLYEMKQLRYLALSNDLMTNKEEIQKLEKALPNCQITAAKGFCVGSGWILLFLPLVFVSMGMAAIRAKRRSAGVS